MSKVALRCCASGIALSLAWTMPATAQTAPAATEAPATDTDAAPQAAAEQSDDIVVTATSGERSRFRSSISVSQVSQDAIRNFTPRSEAEVLRNIPGLQPSDTAGPGGNANIGVRGIPVSTGGSEYVALQEDGLPVTLFGDINFGNNDYWIRFDQNVERVEAVRGGSSSTFASQAPGAVINYLSKTGDRAGGSAAFSKGLDFRENRVDFDYGAPISDSLRFHVGGFARNGGGLTNEDFNILRGYQIKANVTKDLPDNRGYVRLLFKRLDEQAPTSSATPALARVENGKITDFSALPGLDPRDGSTYSIYNRAFQFRDYDGQLRSAEVEGIHPRVTSIGGQLHYEFDNGVTVDDTIRYQDMSGNFTTQFANALSTSSLLGSTVNGQRVGAIRYAAGPNAGQLFTGQFVNNNPNINTLMKDMGNFANNLTVSGKYDVLGGSLRATAGWFHMSQTIRQDWHVNRQYSELVGENAAPLDLFSTTGARLTAAGQAGFNDNWGTCCARRVDLTYTNDAPFVSLSYENGGLDLDGSVRFDTVKGEGTAQGGVQGPVTVVNGAAIPSLVLNPAAERIDYRDSYVSWSFGALYALNTHTSLFARVSRGGRFNADRRVLSGNFNADGSLNAQGRNTSVNFLNQQEIGWKQRGEVMSGSYSVEVTGFRSTLTENNFDFTRLTNLPPNNNPNISNSYRSMGIEFTGRFNLGNFRLAADATYIESKITDSATPALRGNRPGGQPRLIYLISPSYDAGFFAGGVSVSGQTSVPLDDFNTLSVKGSTFLNGYLKVRPTDQIEVGLNANNLLNTLGFRGGGSVVPLVPASATSTLFQATAVYGRTVTASIRYNF
ncbi:TonB-dependent receptor [Sphingomonas sp. NY01]|uniref:TonB-dependent receptor domain-containing protein n=1 Tax=Sphingomonas sp. NY01 TaxID=2968057 RepID=UPI00315D9C43